MSMRAVRRMLEFELTRSSYGLLKEDPRAPEIRRQRSFAGSCDPDDQRTIHEHGINIEHADFR